MCRGIASPPLAARNDVIASRGAAKQSRVLPTVRYRPAPNNTAFANIIAGPRQNPR